jgi:hypothetical protein
VDAVDRRGLPDAGLKAALSQSREELQWRGLRGAALEEALDREKTRLLVRLGVRRPFLSANDRSRWCTVRALVEPEMRVAGAPYAIDKVIQQPGWDTIDMVKRGDHLYSSKPPLLATLVAGEYWTLYHLSRLPLVRHPLSLAEQPYTLGRFMLITINGGLLVLYFWSLARLIERLGTTDWGRVFVMAAAVMGTLVTSFAVVLTNHLPGAACTAVLLDAWVGIAHDGDRRLRTFALAGFFAAFLATNELPAGALAAVVSLALLWRAPRQTLLAYVPPALVVTAAFFATNWIAVQSWKPAYMHRGGTDNWYDYTYTRNGRLLESYWKGPQGIDRGEPSELRYVFNALIGHHGIFSLTPIWLLSVCGTLLWLRRDAGPPLRRLALALAGVTLVCLTFYLAAPGVDRNYGGTTSGFRWVFWMAPLWLVLMLPCADAASRRRAARAVALILLAVSVLSASYPTWNPFTHPWLMDYMSYLGWLK